MNMDEEWICIDRKEEDYTGRMKNVPKRKKQVGGYLILDINEKILSTSPGVISVKICSGYILEHTAEYCFRRWKGC